MHSITVLAEPSWSCSKAVYKPIWHIPSLSAQWITLDDGQRNCPKHVEFRSQNKFEKLVHIVGFVVRKFVTMHGHMNVKSHSYCEVGHVHFPPQSFLFHYTYLSLYLILHKELWIQNHNVTCNSHTSVCYCMYY
jgi:hypothetical protein